MTEDGEKRARAGIAVVGDRTYPVDYSEEELREMDEEEQAWVDLVRFIYETALNLGEAVDDHPWEGYIAPVSRKEKAEYRMKIAVGSTDSFERPAVVMVDLYENDFHAEQAIATAIWDLEDNVELWDYHPEPSMRITERDFSLKDIALEAKKVIENSILENAVTDANMEFGFNTGELVFPLLSPIPDVTH